MCCLSGFPQYLLNFPLVGPECLARCREDFMARILLMIASLASLLVCLAVSDAESAVLIKPIVKPGFKGPRYAVTGQGRQPLIGDRITVESGATGDRKSVV